MRNLSKFIVPVFAIGLMSSCGLEKDPEVSSAKVKTSCDEGMNKEESSVAFTVRKGADGKYVAAVTDKAYQNNVLGLYVTSADAKIPKAPPPNGEVTGTNYWSIASASGLKTFSSPITYRTLPKGAKDTTAVYNGIAGGTPMSEIPDGTCLKVSLVTVKSFKFSVSSFFVAHQN